MYPLSNFTFPENPEEYKLWKPIFKIRRLHKKVLIVAKTEPQGTWIAFCVPVPGKDHNSEWKLWKTGIKILEKYARPMFPEFQDLPYSK